MDHGMVHIGGKRDSRVWENRQLRQLSRVQSGYCKSRTDLNLLVRCPSTRPAVWQDWHVGFFFSSSRTPATCTNRLGVESRLNAVCMCTVWGPRVVLCCCRSQLNPRELQSGLWGASPVFAPCLPPERPSLPMTASASRSWCSLNRDTIFDTEQTRIQPEPMNLSNRNPGPVYVTLPFPRLRIVLLTPPPRSHIHTPPTPHILRNSTD